MTDRASRRFNLADLMIVVAASGVALVLWRVYHETGENIPSMLGLRGISFWAREASPFLFASALALLAMRLLPPRPPARRLFRQPGTVACLAVVVGVLFEVAQLAGQTATIAWFQPGSGMSVQNVHNYAGAVVSSGYRVALMWAAPALARAWRPEPSWIDRTGRCLGWLLIAGYLPVACWL